VSSSGLIYAAIALLWVAVLIPMWLRGHDSTVENRSAERFGQAMRVLSRRSEQEDDVNDASGERVEPEHVDDQSSTPSPAIPQDASPHSSQAMTHRVVRSARSRAGRPRPSLVKRRARTLFVLMAMTVLFALLATTSLLPWWAPIPVATLLVAFVVHLRGQAKRNEALRARRLAGRTADSQPDAAALPVEEPTQAAPREAKPRRSMSFASFVSGPSRAMVVETKGVGATVTHDEAIDDEAWRPNPLPLPTYVTAPKAIRPIRVIDLTTPGAWSSGRLIDDEAIAEEDVLAAEMAADELDAMLEHEAKGPDATDDSGRRAVGD